ncbi:hypothetical protein E4K72_19770 [Oxalobacteraceae bacterium OM1]|nr:hypothetical protein E4K72_19770 [Oxalobacteraceae bacterium OM1]
MKKLFITASLAAVALGGFAQTTSPFGVATSEEIRAAKANDRIRLSALAAWDKLPAKQKQALLSNFATLTSEQRLALINKTPGLASLSDPEKQALLDYINTTVPLPVTPPLLNYAITNATFTPFNDGTGMGRFSFTYNLGGTRSGSDGTCIPYMFAVITDASGVVRVTFRSSTQTCYHSPEQDAPVTLSSPEISETFVNPFTVTYYGYSLDESGNEVKVTQVYSYTFNVTRLSP